MVGRRQILIEDIVKIIVILIYNYACRKWTFCLLDKLTGTKKRLVQQKIAEVVLKAIVNGPTRPPAPGVA